MIITTRPWILAAALATGMVSCDHHDQDHQSDPPHSPAKKNAASPQDWPITRGGGGLQGRVPGPVLQSPEIDWTITLEHPIEAEAAVAGNTLVVGDLMGTIYAIDLNSRQIRWQTPTEDSIEAAPLINQNRVFIGSADGSFRALSLDDGSELWRITGDDKFSSGANLIPHPDGPRLVVNGYDGTTRCLDPANGKVIWTHPTRDFINGTPALLENGHLAFGGCDSIIHILDASTGNPTQQIQTDAQITNSVATSRNQIFAANYANQIVATEFGRDTPLWTYQSSKFPFFSAPAVDDQHVYIGCRDKSLHAIDRQTGQQAWTFPTGARVESSPIVFDDAVVFGSSDGRLYAVTPNTGKLIWKRDLGENLIAPPVSAHNRLIIGGNHGTLFVLK